ncbi:MAG: hypothetical protein ACOC0P_01540, partial [Planctomycetota bacterium]
MTDRSQMLRTAVLRHETADGDVHFDWLLAVDDPPMRRLITARTSANPAEIVACGPHSDMGRHRVGTESDAGTVVMAFEPIATHRVLYLTYEGPIPRDRGTVARVAEGWWLPCLRNPDDEAGSEADEDRHTATPSLDHITRILNGRTDPQPSETVWPHALTVRWDPWEPRQAGPQDSLQAARWVFDRDQRIARCELQPL